MYDVTLLTFNDPLKEGHLPIHVAAIFNHLEMVKFLIESGCNINALDEVLFSTTLII